MQHLQEPEAGSMAARDKRNYVIYVHQDTSKNHLIFSNMEMRTHNSEPLLIDNTVMNTAICFIIESAIVSIIYIFTCTNTCSTTPVEY